MYRSRPRTSRILLFKEEFEEDAGLAEIDAVHRSKGALSCGYHYVVRKDGTAQEGRDVGSIGWHTPGYNNDSVAVGYVVNPGEDITEEQLSNGLLVTLRVKYPEAKVEFVEDPR